MKIILIGSFLGALLGALIAVTYEGPAPNYTNYNCAQRPWLDMSRGC